MSFFRPLTDVALDYRRWATDPRPRIPTGYELMDSRTNGGAAAGEVIMLTCRSQVGKTTFALNTVVNHPEVPTVFFSLEMNARYLIPRLAAMLSGTPTDQIEKDMMTTGRSAVVEEAVELLSPTLAVLDKPAMTIKEMGISLQETQQAWGQKVRYVCIDFLELIGGVPSLSTVDKIDGLTRRIKDFAREHDVVVLLLHQVSRSEGDEGDKPLSITSGRFGGEVSADYVLGAYRPCLAGGITQQEFLTKRWYFYLQFLKTRGGPEIHPQGELHCFDPNTMRITHPFPQRGFSFDAEGPVPPAELVTA